MAEQKDDSNNNPTTPSSFESDEDFTWISYFLSLKGNEFFVEIDENYISDNFNLTGLQSEIPYYEYALDLIIDVENEECHKLSDEHQEMIENDAEILYGLIHARYILTNRGLHAMLQKYRHNTFGTCPRYQCKHQSTLPIGITDQKGKYPIKLYCPRCEEIYRPRSVRHENIDGACFGTTFPHLFFMVFPELKPKKTTDYYIPRVFGYKLHRTWRKRSIQSSKQSHIAYKQNQKRLHQMKLQQQHQNDKENVADQNQGH